MQDAVAGLASLLAAASDWQAAIYLGQPRVEPAAKHKCVYNQEDHTVPLCWKPEEAKIIGKTDGDADLTCTHPPIPRTRPASTVQRTCIRLTRALSGPQGVSTAHRSYSARTTRRHQPVHSSNRLHSFFAQARVM